MNIREYIDYMKSIRGDRSFAFLAERCETSPENPYRIRPADKIGPDEVLVCMLCGSSNDNRDYIREYNGYLKQVDEFVKASPKLKDKKVRVCVAICNFGKYHDTDMARYLQHIKHSDPQEYTSIINSMLPETKEEMTNPAYIQDIFDATIKPRISHNDTIRQSQGRALRNMRRLNFVTHCNGAFVAIELEDKTLSKTKVLGFSSNEQDQIFANQMVLNFNPEGAKNHSRSKFITIQSASDTHNPHTNFMEEYLLMRPRDFGFMYYSSKNINTLMCAQVDKAGIEGNPPRVYIARPIEEVMEEAARARADAIKNETKEPEEEKYVGEHSFMGFTPKPNMSQGAIKIQKLAGNILENAVYNSTEQTIEEFVPLPSFMNLAANDRNERFEIAKAYLKGWQITGELMITSSKKVAAHNAHRRRYTVEL